MPSDTRAPAALAALASQRDRFRAAVGLAVDQVLGFLDTRSAGDDQRQSRIEAELGHFAAGRLDPASFANMFAAPGGIGPDERAVVERAAATLREVLDAGDSLFLREVPAGASLGAVVADALAECGRAFGAALAVDHVRQGVHSAPEHEHLLRACRFRAWNRAERALAPPIIVRLQGDDVRCGELAEFMDGGVKIVLLVHGAMTPAPLAGLVTPGVFVAQAADEQVLERAARWDGPAVVSIGGQGGARFVHDPAAGAQYWERLTMEDPVPEPAKRSIGGLSPPQQAEGLRHLEALAARPNEAGSGVLDGASTSVPLSNDPADRLAGWLLREAHRDDGAPPRAERG